MYDVALKIRRRAQTPILDGLDRIERMVSTLVIALPASVPVILAIPPTSATDASCSVTTYTDPKIALERLLATPPAYPNGRQERWGVRGAWTTSSKAHHVDYSVTFSINYPWHEHWVAMPSRDACRFVQHCSTEVLLHSGIQATLRLLG